MRIVLAFVLVVTACGAAPHPESAVPDSQAGRQLRWLLDVFAKGGSVDEPTLRHHFADEFLAKVPPPQLVVAFGSLTKHLKGMTITKIDAPSPTSVLLHGAVTEARFVLALTVEPTRGLITDLDVHPNEGPPPTSFEDVLQRTHGRAVVRRCFGMQDSERDAHALLDVLGLVEGPSTIAAELSNDQIPPCGNLADEA
jgi:ORF 12 gene product N-terminal